jgi:hypothetical protein
MEHCLVANTVDVPVAIRGASAGFSVLLLGTLLAQFAAAFLPTAAGIVLISLSVILGFAVAARKTGTSTVPALHGAVAAELAYLLVLPLQWHFGRPELSEVIFTIAAALAVGAATPTILARIRPV